MTITDEAIAYSIKEAGHVSRLGETAVRALIESGDLRTIPKPPTGRHQLVLREDLLAVLRKLRDA